MDELIEYKNTPSTILCDFVFYTIPFKPFMYLLKITVRKKVYM